MFIDENTSRADLEIAILSDDALYQTFDEGRLLDGGYSNAEMVEMIGDWIAAGDECAVA